MPLRIDKIGRAGSIPSRRRFWDDVAEVVRALRKLPGDNVSITEYDSGSLIDVNPQRQNKQVSATGACCADGSCSIITESDCNDLSGHYLGDGTTCEGVDCTQGACCHPDGSCTLGTETDCTDVGGAFQGYGTTCEGVDCSHTGACCDGMGVCTITRMEDCAGDYQGDGTICEPNPCPDHSGACCKGDVCDIETPTDCIGSGGIYMGDGTTCDPTPCPVTMCHSCAFFNPDDGQYYLTRTETVSADFNDPVFHRTAHFDSVKVITCNGDGSTSEVCSGTGTYDAPSCHCDMTMICGGPAFGFWGLSGMTFTEVCSPPSCSTLLSCDFGNCTSTLHVDFSNPCDHSGFSPPP